MPEISVVGFIEIKKEFRLDAEYYRPTFLNVDKIMEKMTTKTLGKLLADIKTSAFYSSISFYYKKDKGIPFVRVSDIEEPFLNMQKILRLPPNIVDKEKGLSTVTNEYILVSKGGTTGNVCLIPTDVEKLCISRDIIGIKINENEIDKDFLLIFLLTRFGKAQLLRGISRQTLPHLTINVLKKIRVPILEKDLQLHAKLLITQAYEKRKLAEAKYSLAETLLFETLKIDKEEIRKLEEEKTYNANVAGLQKMLRFDAEYYHPKYLGTLDLLKNCPFDIKPLKRLISTEMIDPTKDPYKNKIFHYVPIAKINESGEIFEWEEFYGWQAPSRARMLIREKDILIPSLTGTFSKIALVPKELDGQLATTGCFVVRPKEENIPEFLFLLLRSLLFIRQLEQQTTGAIMSAVPKKTLEILLIPMVPKDVQRSIADLIKDYFYLRAEARRLVQKAVKEVEKMIENVSANID